MKHAISVLQCQCDSVTVCLTKMYVLLVFTTLLLRCNVADLKSTQKQEERGSASMDGDFIFGALYSVHHQPKSKRTDLNNILKCGDVRELYGIQRIEVTFQTLEAINRDPNILPNITLGVEIRDSCWYAPVALQQSIELIRDSISPNMINEDDICPVAQSEDEPQTNADIAREGEASSAALWRRRPLIGVIGPGSSSVALQVQNLLQLFHIPQIGYSTTSKDLSDKSRFNYFQRVVPSDYYQAQVMVDVVRRFNWTYVSAVNTDENYGQSGIQAFRELAERADVCIAREDSVLSNADDEAFEDVIINLQQDASARVVVCFCEGLTVRGLLAAVQRRNLTGRFLFIGSDGWADRSDVTEKYEPVAHGSLSIRIHSPYVKSFDAYYFGLRPETNIRNPWFKEFWQVRFGCKFPDEPSHPDDGASVATAGTQLPIISDDHGTETVTDVWPEITSNSDDRKLCTGEEDLSEGYKQDPKLSFVIKAIYTLAYGLHSMQQDVCGTAAVGLCPRLYPFNGSLFKSYLMNVSFTYEDGDAIEFDTRGDPPGRYDIMNYQLLKNGTYDYVQVGDWNNGTLSFTGDIQFGAEPGIRESVCSRPCEPGSRKTFQVGGQDKRCCWVCQQCGSDERLFNETYCDKCPLGTLPDLTKTYCYEIPVEFVKWSDTQAIVAIVFSCLGFLTTIFSLSVFVRYNNTPVVKSSTRELSYLILAGMTLSHAATFPILSKPSQASCSLSRTLPGISFAMIYASLLVKTNRIARILAGSKKRFPSRKLRFMSATSQVLITCCLISLEVGFSIAMLVYEPAASTVVYPSRDRAALVCNTTPTGVVAPLAFDFFLIALCTVYALKTRNVPENFNEAKFIGFAMYTTCVIWIAFVPIYFGSETKIITMCMCVTLSAMVTFAFLFLPKLYIILLRPERNNRALFTTSKSIRCHIGTRVASAVSEKSSFTSSLGYQDSTHWKGDLYAEMPTVGLIASSDVAAAATTKNVNWKDRPDRLKSSFNREHRKPERRTLSCQTGDELLQLLLESRQCKSSKADQKLTYCPTSNIKDDLPEWAELNPKTLMNETNGYSPIIKYRSPKQDQRSPKLTISKLTTSKARIREESASDCSLSDNDSCQLKNITINIGSITSIHTINRTSNNGAVTPIVNRKRSVTPSSWNHVNHNRSINSSPTHSLA